MGCVLRRVNHHVKSKPSAIRRPRVFAQKKTCIVYRQLVWQRDRASLLYTKLTFPTVSTALPNPQANLHTTPHTAE